MTNKTESRRNFMKSAAVLAVGGAAATVTSEARAQGTIALNPSAKSVMTDGSILTRQQILKSLNLDPNTNPEAWLAIVACGSNASALDPVAATRMLNSGEIKTRDLNVKSLEKIRGYHNKSLERLGRGR